MDAMQDINMDIADAPGATNVAIPEPQVQIPTMYSIPSFTAPHHANTQGAVPPQVNIAPQHRETIRDIPVKVHVRRPDRDNWAYLGRAVVIQEVVGQSSRIVVRSASSRKILTTFGEGAALQAEKRGNFVVVGCVEGSRVVSWSLNALNNSETLRLLAIIELSCYSCKHAVSDQHSSSIHRRRIARAIKEDRRKRHKRRKDQEAMVAAFERTGLASPAAEDEPQPVMQQ